MGGVCRPANRQGDPRQAVPGHPVVVGGAKLLRTHFFICGEKFGFLTGCEPQHAKAAAASAAASVAHYASAQAEASPLFQAQARAQAGAGLDLL